jgi:dTDP-4-dehydrorhamnose 3,5-epimerase
MGVIVTPQRLEGVLLLRPDRRGDTRGWFSVTWNRDDFAACGVTADFIQDNHSLSRQPGTVRGLHAQMPPFAQAKLIRVIAGAIRDVVVDIRRNSPTYGQSLTIDLDATIGEQVFVPHGFLHGFLTLEPDTQVAYKVDAPWSPDHEIAVRWNDPAIAIDWGIDADTAILSEKDAAAPGFARLVSPF